MRNTVISSRGLSWRPKVWLAGLAVLGASAAGLALPGTALTALAASNASATTAFTAHPDTGNHGVWADDDFTRNASVTLVNVDSTVSDCGSKATSCFQYSGTISDSGTFTAISGASSPQAGVTIAGTPAGPFRGGISTITFVSSSDVASASGVPATVNGAGTVSTADWVEQFFPSGTTFGAGPKLTNPSFTYYSPNTCEYWTNSAANGGGANAADGDITGRSHCLTPTGGISTFVNHSASCLDNTGFTWSSGNPEQIWRCGAAGGADQNFRLAMYGGSEVLESVAPRDTSISPWCVTEPGGIGQLTIQPCTGTGGQVVKKAGPYYVFTADGEAMDLRQSNTRNGNAVIAFPQNGGRNQRWSLP